MRNAPPPRPSGYVVVPALALAYLEHLRAAVRAHVLSGRPLVLHCDRLRVLDFRLLPALHAVSLQGFLRSPCLYLKWLTILDKR